MNEKQSMWRNIRNKSFIGIWACLNIHSDFSSKRIMMQLCNEIWVGHSDLTYAVTDVRDVAIAHIKAASIKSKW